MNRQTVLVMDPRKADLDATVRALEGGGYSVTGVATPQTAISNLLEFHPDGMVCALDLGSAGGATLVGSIRRVSDLPVIVIAREANPRALQLAAEMRIDGLLVEPFSERELLARMETALSGRSSPDSLVIFRHEDLIIDWRRFDVWVNNELVHLSPTEFRLLSLLVRRRGWVVTYDEILADVWGDEDTYDRDHIKLYVWHLRRKIERDPASPRLILTKRGIGYMFADEETGVFRDPGRRPIPIEAAAS